MWEHPRCLKLAMGFIGSFLKVLTTAQVVCSSFLALCISSQFVFMNSYIAKKASNTIVPSNHRISQAGRDL